MGLSGAEDAACNERFIDFLKDQHGDIAEEFLLASDAVMSLKAAFPNGSFFVFYI